MMVNLIKLVLLVILFQSYVKGQLSPTDDYDSSLSITTTSEPDLVESVTLTSTSTVKPPIVRQARTTSTPSISSPTILATTTPQSDDIVTSTSKPNYVSAETSDIDPENNKEEVNTEVDKEHDTSSSVTVNPIIKSIEKKVNDSELIDSTPSPKELPKNEGKLETETSKPEKNMLEVISSTISDDIDESRNDPKTTQNPADSLVSKLSTEPPSTSTSTTPNPEPSPGYLNDEGSMPKDSPDNRVSRANSALLSNDGNKKAEKWLNDKKDPKDSAETTEEGDKSESKESLNKPAAATLTGSTESYEFPEDDLDNLTLPNFETNSVVDILNGNDSTNDPEAPAVKSFSVEGSSGSGLLIRIFQGPDRSKLPVDSKAEDIYRYISGIVDNETSLIAKSILPHVVELGFKVRIDGKCSRSILAISNGVKAKKTWAFQFLDSYGRREDGFLAGTLSSLGNFDQCLKIRATDDAISEEDEFSGKYCLAQVKPPLPEQSKDGRFTFKSSLLNYAGTELENTYLEEWGSFAHELYSNAYTIGMCIPSTCQSKDIAKILNELANPFNFTVTFNARCTPETNYWEAQSPPEYALFILCLLGLMVGFGTAYDFYIRKKEENCLGRLFAAFSSISNTHVLLGHKKGETKKEKLAKERQMLAGQSLSWIHGLQFLSVCWIVIANVYQLGGLPIAYLLKNLNMDFRSQGGSLMFQFILNSWDYMAELFFLLSGFVFCLGLLGARERKRCPTFGRFFIRQWLSFAPSIIGAILITLIVFQWSWQDGPSFSRAEKLIVEPCNQNGVASIFLFNNWLPVKDMCLPQTWFLSALFQLQLIGFMVILIIHRKPALGVTLSLLLILLGIILPGLLTYQYNLPPTMLLNNPNIQQLRDDLSIQYFATYNHLSSYFVGILLAYLIYKKPAKPIINKGLRFAIWIVLGAISLSSILITCKWNGFKDIPNQTSSIIYSALHRIAFISFFIWLTHQFTFKQGGIVGRFLSWKAFKTLNGLSLQVYLVHLIIIWNYFLTKRDLVDYRNFELTVDSFGIILASLFCGYLMYLFIEAPFHQITAGFVKCLFGCDLKSRLREYENEADANIGDSIGEEKKTTIEESLCTVDGSTLGNNEVRIEVSSPTEDNSQDKQQSQLNTESKNDQQSNQEQISLQDQPQAPAGPQAQPQPNGINNNGVVIRL